MNLEVTVFWVVVTRVMWWLEIKFFGGGAASVFRVEVRGQVHISTALLLPYRGLRNVSIQPPHCMMQKLRKP